MKEKKFLKKFIAMVTAPFVALLAIMGCDVVSQPALYVAPAYYPEDITIDGVVKDAATSNELADLRVALLRDNVEITNLVTTTNFEMKVSYPQATTGYYVMTVDDSPWGTNIYVAATNVIYVPSLPFGSNFTIYLQKK